MKKITLTLTAFIAAIALQAQEVQIPAAYYNGSVTPVAETVGSEAGSFLLNPDNLQIPFTGIYGPHARNMSPTLIYDNGTFINELGPPELSICENNTLGMSTYGFGVQLSGSNSIADDFILNETIDVAWIDTYAYQTGSTPPSITGVYIQVYDGDPSAGGNVIWGDFSTNLLDYNEGTGVYRVLESAIGDTTREVQSVTAATSGLILEAGTYWMEVTFEGAGTSGPWAPPISILGEPTTGNALQFTGTSGVWQPLLDGGSMAPQGLPFQIHGTPILSVNNNALDGFSFYPNPTTDMLNLNSKKNIDSVTLYNLLGQKVMTSSVGATSTAISLSGLSSGAYIMEVIVNGSAGTFKVIKS